MLDGISPKPGLSADTDRGISLDKLKEACIEFESIFITQILKARGVSLAGEGDLLNNNEGKIIKSMFDENLGGSIAKSGGIGLADLLIEEIQ